MKKYRGIQLFLVSSVLLFGLTVFAAEQQAKTDETATMEDVSRLVASLEQTGAEVDSIHLHHGGVYDTYDQLEEVETMALRLATDMTLQPTSDDNQEQSGQVAFPFEHVTGSIRTEMKVIAQPSHVSPGKWETYLTVTLHATQKDLGEKLSDQFQIISEALLDHGISTQFYSCTQGNINDKLAYNAQMEHLNTMTDFLGAKVVEEVADSTVISRSAYSPEFPYYIWTDGNKMNVQVGMHVDHLHGQTRITVGTPIITIEY